MIWFSRNKRPASVTMHSVDFSEVELRVLAAEAAHRREADDRWLDLIPTDVYDPCPCGCGRAWRFVEKGGEAELKKHADAFAAKYVAKGE